MRLTHAAAVTVAISMSCASIAQASESVSSDQPPARISRAKPHDTAATVTHTFYSRANAIGVLASAQGTQTPCDSLLCPSYTMIGVGF